MSQQQKIIIFLYLIVRGEATAAEGNWQGKSKFVYLSHNKLPQEEVI